jgi:hypothetical protein
MLLDAAAVRTILDVVQERQGLVRAFLAHGATDRALAAGLRQIGTHMTSRLVMALRESAMRPPQPHASGRLGSRSW